MRNILNYNDYATNEIFGLGKKEFDDIANKTFKELVDNIENIKPIKFADNRREVTFTKKEETESKENKYDKNIDIVRGDDDMPDSDNRDDDVSRDKSDDNIVRNGDKNVEDKSIMDKGKQKMSDADVYRNSKNFLQSVVDLHECIINNVVRFKEEEYDKKFNVVTHFDIVKFNNLKKRFEKSKPKDKLSILRQLVQMCEDLLDTLKSTKSTKKDKSNINLFTQYFNKYSALLSGMERDKEKKGVKSHGDVDNTEKSNIGVRSENLILNYDYFLNEAEASLWKEESHAKNAWKKVVNAHRQSNISKFIPQIEQLLETNISSGKDEYKQAKKDIMSICKQVILNKSTVGTPISFGNLIKEQININDISKSIALFGRVLLAFKEDIGLTGAYGSAIKPIKIFVNSFTELEKFYTEKISERVNPHFLRKNKKQEIIKNAKELKKSKSPIKIAVIKNHSRHRFSSKLLGGGSESSYSLSINGKHFIGDKRGSEGKMLVSPSIVKKYWNFLDDICKLQDKFERELIDNSEYKSELSKIKKKYS